MPVIPFRVSRPQTARPLLEGSASADLPLKRAFLFTLHDILRQTCGGKKHGEDHIMFELFGLFERGWYFKADGGAGDDPKTEDSAGDKLDESKDKSKDVKAGDDPTKTKDEKSFSQAEVDQIIKERLERAQKKSESEAEKARKKAEEEALTKNNEFQKLAEQRQVRLDELEKGQSEFEAVKEQADKYKGALDKQLKVVKEKLPKHILPLLDKMDPIEAMDYIAKNAKDLGVSLATYGETPNGKDKTLTDDEKADGKQAQASLVRRNF